MEAMTLAAAKEWANIPIRCNAVRPGFIKTPIMDDFSQDMLEKVYKPTIGMGRFGKVEGQALTVGLTLNSCVCICILKQTILVLVR